MSKDAKRGGARPGAGRKPAEVKSVSISFRLPMTERDALYEYLKKKNISMASFVNEALKLLDR